LCMYSRVVWRKRKIKGVVEGAVGYKRDGQRARYDGLTISK
jgi:hypothetical protein